MHTWFADYLPGRTQRVVLNGHSSQVTKVSSGVPQGSILGPLLFSIYIDWLCSILLSTTSKIQLYADDMLLHKPIGRDCTLDVANFQRDMDSVAVWVNLSGLRLNTHKTKFLLVSRLRHPPPIELRVDGTIIPRVPSVTYLGVSISVTSPGQPTLTPHVAKPNGRLDCYIGTFMLEVLPAKPNSASHWFYPFLTIALPFGTPTMLFMSTSWNQFKNLQLDLSLGDGMTIMTLC